MAINVILNLLAALILLGGLYLQQRRHASFSVRVFTGMGLGVVLGAALQAIYGAGSAELKTTGDYLDIVGSATSSCCR
jgi:L-cystine uptake protein TcyP (sodium:dicarboxylate symporter family)